MLYRENGQFKSTYRADQQMLPILQDRIFMLLGTGDSALLRELHD